MISIPIFAACEAFKALSLSLLRGPDYLVYLSVAMIEHLAMGEPYGALCQQAREGTSLPLQALSYLWEGSMISEEGEEGSGSEGQAEGFSSLRQCPSFRSFHVGEWMERMEGMEHRLRDRLLPLMLPLQVQ